MSGRLSSGLLTWVGFLISTTNFYWGVERLIKGDHLIAFFELFVGVVWCPLTAEYYRRFLYCYS